MCISLSVLYMYDTSDTWPNPNIFCWGTWSHLWVLTPICTNWLWKKTFLWQQDQPTPVVISALKKVDAEPAPRTTLNSLGRDHSWNLLIVRRVWYMHVIYLYNRHWLGDFKQKNTIKTWRKKIHQSMAENPQVAVSGVLSFCRFRDSLSRLSRMCLGISFKACGPFSGGSWEVNPVFSYKLSSCHWVHLRKEKTRCLSL